MRLRTIVRLSAVGKLIYINVIYFISLSLLDVRKLLKLLNSNFGSKIAICVHKH